MHVVSVEGNRFEGLFRLEPGEATRLIEQMNVLNVFEDVLILPGTIIFHNIRDLFGYRIGIQSCVAREGMETMFDMPLHRSHVMRHILNILASFRAFVDVVDHRLGECFDSPAMAKQVFKESQEKAFDSSFGYRFLSKFRNYAQHFGVPLDNIVFDIEKLQAGIVSLRLVVRKERLMAYSGWGGKVKAELEALPNELVLDPMLSELHGTIAGIQRAVLNLRLQSHGGDINAVLGIYRKAKRISGRQEIAILDDSSGPTQGKLHFMNIGLLEMLDPMIQS